MKFSLHLMIRVSAFMALLQTTQAHLPPTAEQLAELQATGKLEQSEDFASGLGNDRFSPDIVVGAQYRLKAAGLKAQGYTDEEIRLLLPQAIPPPNRRNLPTTGTPKTLTLLVDFADYRAATQHPEISRPEIYNNIYGPGTQFARDNGKPYDSVSNYWNRASQGNLSIRGNVTNWANLAGNRSTWGPSYPLTATKSEILRYDNQANFDVVKAAMEANDADEDYAQYDNDGDGYIDAINVIWTGPTGAWATFWWGYRWNFFVDDAATTTFDGKKVRNFTWQKLETRDNNRDYNPTTLIHETGHLLGLPDLYDYKPASGLRGGVGGFDIMDGNRGNPNGFFRWMMDWISPVVVGAGGLQNYTLRASGDSAATGTQAVVIFPNASSSQFQEFFLVENRTRTGNDGGLSSLPADGLAIWHVDSTLTPDGNDFAFRNTDEPTATAHKLVRLVQADDLDSIEINASALDAGDYWNLGDVFGSTRSQNYARTLTDVNVSNISADGLTMTADIGFSSATVAPDLASTAAGFQGVLPTTRAHGEVANFTGKITNFGNAIAAPFRVRFVTTIYSSNGASVFALGHRDITSPTPAGATVVIDTPVTIPSELPAGTYGLRWEIDSNNTVRESKESNNTVYLAQELTVTGPPVSEIRVEGAGQEITSGDTAPTTEKGTLFGQVDLNAEVTRIYQIRNTGNVNLVLGSPAVTVTGSGAASFRVITQPLGPVTAGSSAAVIVGFRPATAGLKSATLSISSSDADENPFTFRLEGTGQVPDDHGNTSGTATTLAVGGSMAGVIGTAGDDDFFKFVFPSAGTLTVWTTGTMDTHGTFYSSTGTELESMDDAGGTDGTNFRIERFVTAGSYFVKVRSYNSLGTGSYSLVSQFVSTSVDDYGNTPAAAFGTGLHSTTTSGRLEAGGDIDCFRLTVPGTGVLTISTTGQTDTYGTLQNAEALVFAQDDDGGNDRNFSLSAIVPPGTYYVLLKGYSAATTGAYSLQVAYSTYIPPDDHGNFPEGATALALNGGADGVLDYFVDDDYFKVVVPSAGTLTVYSTGSRDTLGNLATSNIIQTEDDDAAGLTNFGISYAVTAQTYYIRVKAFSPLQLGNYHVQSSFRATGTDDYANFPGEGTGVFTMTGTAGTRAASLEAGGDVDYFKIILATDGLLTLDTTGTTDTFGTLRTADGTLEITDDDTGADSNFQIPRYLAAGTYFVEVRGFNRTTTTGPYTMRWNLVPGPPADDFGNTAATASATAWPGTKAGNLNYAGDEDVFSIILSQPASLRIYTTGTTDTYGRLLNTGGSVLASDDDSGDGNNFSFVATLAAGTYYVKTSGYTSGITGTYTLHVERLPAFNVTAMSATGTTGLNLTWASDPGATYRIESATNLGGPWTTVQNNLPGNNTGSSTASISFSPGEPRRFYRVAKNL